MQALVLIPTYNERGNIENLIHQIFNLNLDINILVVDDNSSDGTAEILKEIQKEQPRLSVIHRSGRRGRGWAGIAGFKYGLRQNVEYVIEMDADFSHAPEYIPLFLNEIEGYDVIIGSRLVKGGGIVGRGCVRKTLSYLGQYLIRFILGLGIRDSSSGFRCFRRCCLQAIDWDKLISRGPSIVEEMIFYLKKCDFRIKEVPIIFKERHFGKSKLNLLRVFEVLFTLIRLRLFYGGREKKTTSDIKWKRP